MLQGYGRNDVAKTNHIGMKFSTPDQDNDLNKRANCAKQDRSGWWFNSCSAANLNGFYHGGKVRFHSKVSSKIESKRLIQ